MTTETLAAGAGLGAPLGERRTIHGGGGALEYGVLGDRGPHLILVNAFGQGLQVWQRVAQQLARTHRVVSWKPRGTFDALDRPHTVFDQVADLERIVEAERIDECRLVTWCSGAKVGLEYARRHARATALVVTNGTFKSLPGLEHLETPFEQLLLQLCHAVVRNAELAGTVMSSMKTLLLGRRTGGAGSPPAGGGAAPSGGTVPADTSELAPMIVEPFEQKQSTIKYSQQVINYLGHDIGPTLRTLDRPVLFLSGERDVISSPQMSHMVSRRVAGACYGEVARGSHYCLHERPDAMAELIETFFSSPSSFAANYRNSEVTLG